MEEIELPYLYEVKIEMQYNPNFGDHKVCQCGFLYSEHFSPWMELEETYNGCSNFVLAVQGSVLPEQARKEGLESALSGEEYVNPYEKHNIFTSQAYHKGYYKDSMPPAPVSAEMDEMDWDDIDEDWDDDPWAGLEL